MKQPKSERIANLYKELESAQKEYAWQMTLNAGSQDCSLINSLINKSSRLKMKINQENQKHWKSS